MLVVPIANDRIKTSSGLPFKVLAYTNYKADGPAVLAETTVGGPSETVYFDDIQEINGQEVEFVKSDKAYKILETNAYLKRLYQLPQPGDTVTSAGIDYKVMRLKLNVKDQLAAGLIIEAQESTTSPVVSLVLTQIDDVGHSLFAKTKFLDYYSDYSDKGSKVNLLIPQA